MTQHSTVPGAPGRRTAPRTELRTEPGATTAPVTPGPLGAREPSLLARSLAEAAGSFLVIVVGIGATMLATDVALPPSLVLGFAVVAAMIAFGHVSGGHFNPAITLGSALAGRTGWASVLPYVLAQVVGAVAATGLLWLVLSSNPQLTTIDVFFSSVSNGFEEHSPAGFPLASALLIEVIAAALLVAVFLGAGARRAARGLAPFAVGLTYAGLVSFLLPVTNGGVNPVRSTATALFAEGWALEQLWLFWAAPVLGGVIAGLVYRSVDWSSGTRADDAGEVPSGAAAPAAGAPGPTSTAPEDTEGAAGTEATGTQDAAAPGSVDPDTSTTVSFERPTADGRGDHSAQDTERDAGTDDGPTAQRY